jgi:hypothetical protein
MLTNNKDRLVHAGGGAVSMLGVESETVANTLRVLGVKVTASVEVRDLILVKIGSSTPPGKPEEGRESDDETDGGGGEQAQGVPLPKKGASA